MFAPITLVVQLETHCCCRALGVEYELKLCHNVQQIGLSYKSESQLRAQGYDKTPDIKLDIPFAVDDFIVNWVESKAVFGDQRTHDQYIKDQYHSYWNRYCKTDSRG